MDPANGLPTLADALQANDDGELETRLALGDAEPADDEAAQVDVALARARASVRDDRGELALEALKATTYERCDPDHHVAIELLTGAAYVCMGQHERGEELLAAVASREMPDGLRAEHSLQHGIAKFHLGAYEDAERLLASVGSAAGVVHAQSLEYLGRIARARGELEHAAQSFRAALVALSACRGRYPEVAARALDGFTMLAPELLLAQEWPWIERRWQDFDWSTGGMSRQRFWLDLAASAMCETAGDVAGALRWARHAEGSVRGASYRTAALCRLAAVFRGLREYNAHAELVESARAAYAELDLRELAADPQRLPHDPPTDLHLVPLLLAEEIAHTGAAGGAAALLAQYREIVVPALRGDAGDLDRYLAIARSIEAVPLEPDEAVGALAWSYGVLAKYGYRRRATAIALRLARLTGEKTYVNYAEDTLRGTSELFWMTRELSEIRSGLGPSLTATEKAILRLLVRGKTYKEIAAKRGASVKTIDNHVQALFRKFGLHSRGELAAEAIRRGTVTLHAAQPTTDN